MTIRYLLDTNIAIEVLRNRPDGLARKFAENSGRMALSTITVHELRYGVERSSDRTRNGIETDQFVARLVVVPFDEAAADHAATIRASLARTGTPIGAFDLLIAGHARSIGATLVTNNVREFARVPGLAVADWTRPG